MTDHPFSARDEKLPPDWSTGQGDDDEVFERRMRMPPLVKPLTKGQLKGRHRAQEANKHVHRQLDPPPWPTAFWGWVDMILRPLIGSVLFLTLVMVGGQIVVWWIMRPARDAIVDPLVRALLAHHP